MRDHPIRYNVDQLPAHLPKPFMSDEQYHRLYAFTHGADAYMAIGEDPEWHEKRIRPGLTAKQVYRMLPSASDFEYGGYLTKTRIRYAAFGPTSASTIYSKSCTFHSHPTDYEGDPDLPSVRDIYQFLKWRHLRAVTIGKKIIWVLSKTRRTIATIRSLAAWETKNMMLEIHKQSKRHPDYWLDYYMQQVIKLFGLTWPMYSPKKNGQFRRRWPDLLRDSLRIKVSVFER